MLRGRGKNEHNLHGEYSVMKNRRVDLEFQDSLPGVEIFFSRIAGGNQPERVRRFFEANSPLRREP